MISWQCVVGGNMVVSRDRGPQRAACSSSDTVRSAEIFDGWGEVVRGHACARPSPAASAAARRRAPTCAQRPLACADTVPHRVYVQRPRCGLCRFSHCHRIVILISFLGDSPLANDRRESLLKRIFSTRYTETNAYLTKRAVRAVNESSA